MDGISRSGRWDKEIPQDVLPAEQLVLSDKWARKLYSIFSFQEYTLLLDVRSEIYLYSDLLAEP